MTTGRYCHDHAAVPADCVEFKLAARGQSHALLAERLTEDAREPRLANPLLGCTLRVCVGHRVVEVDRSARQIEEFDERVLVL